MLDVSNNANTEISLIFRPFRSQVSQKHFVGVNMRFYAADRTPYIETFILSSIGAFTVSNSQQA